MQVRRTLDELDPPAWGPPPDGSTGLVTQCHALRKKPVADFTVGDLRVMIGQKLSLPYLVPRAIAVLEANPLAEGDLFPGDLLDVVVTINEDYWRTHPDQWLTVREIAGAVGSARSKRMVVGWSVTIGLIAVFATGVAIAGADNGCERGHLLEGGHYLGLVICSCLAALLACAGVVGTRARPGLWAWVLGILLALGVGGLLFGIGVAVMYGDWACTS